MRRILLITTFIVATFVVSASEHNSDIYSPYYAKPSGEYFPPLISTYPRIRSSRVTLSSEGNRETYLRRPRGRLRHRQRFGNDEHDDDSELGNEYFHEEDYDDDIYTQRSPNNNYNEFYYRNHPVYSSSDYHQERNIAQRSRPNFYGNSGPEQKFPRVRKRRPNNPYRYQRLGNRKKDQVYNNRVQTPRYPNANSHGHSSVRRQNFGQLPQNSDFSSSIVHRQSEEYYELPTTTELISTAFASTIGTTTIATTTIAPLDVNDIKVPIEFLRLEYMISFSFLGVMYGLGFLVLFQNLCVTAAKITVTVVYLALRKVGLLQPYTISQALHQIPPLK